MKKSVKILEINSPAISNQFDDLSENFDLILLAIKPQISGDVLTNLRVHLPIAPSFNSRWDLPESLQQLSGHTKVVECAPLHS